jgi:transcription antitermination factor NusG
LKSFVFARVKADQRTTVRLTEGVVNFVYRSGKPVVLKDKLLQGIRQFQETHSEVEVVDIMEQVWVNEDRQGNCGRFAEKQKTASLRLDTLNLVLIARSARPVTTEAKTDKNETCAFFKA